MKKQLNIRGETIVEVLLAMTLLTLILFSAWKLVNRSTQLSLTARKRTEMINQLKEQAEIIKNIYATNQGAMTEFETKVTEGTKPEPNLQYNPDFCEESYLALGATPPTNSFYIAYDDSALGEKLKKTLGPKKVNGNQGSLIWVQWKDGNGPDGKYYDFYIRGCWYTSGAQQKTDNAQFVVRLNR